jgi:type II secretory ATPase GspE/PulE/Tfp pilus assembly ATPase PilB-like protein
MAVIRPTTFFSRDDSAPADVPAPVARVVDDVLRHAIERGASDVHIEPADDGSGRVRYRLDGVMHAGRTIGNGLYAPLVSRIKLLASMDIANRRLPQDGRYAIALEGRRVDARVSSMPTFDGEKLVIRLVDYQTAPPQLDTLGMDAPALHGYRLAAHAPWGFVVVSGPTGSGKTTTLYATIGDLDRRQRNICTVEDPIEGRLPGVSQVGVSVRAGLTFPVALRSLVRQDPDVIMVGEMRDTETAAVAVAAALAGQTVFATVHSNDAPRTIDRLVEFGVARRSLAAALTVVVAQRLLRRLCPACRRTEPVPRELRPALPDSAGTWFVAAGCAACAGTGYAGRTAVFEVFHVDDAIRDAIAAGASSIALAHLARERGHRSLFDDAAAKLAAGATSFAEVERVVGWWVR